MVPETKDADNLGSFFYLWGMLKHNIYSNKPCTEDYLKESIQNDKLCYDGMILSKWNVVVWCYDF
jgi:hypothetical protein